MNCQDIKNQLAIKDKEVAERKAKTIEYFNLVKDDVVDKLIKDHIDGEFKADFYNVFEGSVMEILYSNLGVNTKFFEWNPLMCRSNWSYNCYGLNTIYWLGSPQEPQEELDKLIKDSDEIKNSFDYQMFGKLLVNYIKSKGFKQEVIVSKRTGEKHYYSAFKISRDALENNCCEKNDEVFFVERNGNYKISLFDVLIAIVVAIMVIFIIYNIP